MSCLDSALKTIEAQLSFWSVFLKTHQKKLLTNKIAILAVNNSFLFVLKNSDQNNICVYIVLKAKTEKKFKKLIDPQKRAFLSFEIKTIKKIFFIFCFCFSFKNNICTNVILISILKQHKKPLLTAKKGQNGVFDGQ